MNNNCCETLGGEKFNAVGATFNPTNQTSLGDTGRHGATNTWARWSRRTKANQGISSRAPYGKPAVNKKRAKQAIQQLGGTNTHVSGINGNGTHGHGIGTVPAAIGGPHAKKRTPLAIVKPTRGSFSTGTQAQPHPTQGRTAVPGGFCVKCFATWATIGALVLVAAVVTRS